MHIGVLLLAQPRKCASQQKGEKVMRTRLMRTSLWTPILLALLCAAGNAFGEELDAGALYQITAKHSGKCLDVSGGPGALGNGALVIQWDCNGATNQQWIFTSIGGGYYKILAKHSGKGLDVFGGVFSAANGVIVEQWDYNGSANQMWRVDPLGNGYYSIIARHSGKALGIRGSATDNNAQAEQSDFIPGAANQMWKLTLIPPCARP
jgi:hypothetical protein